MCLYHVLNFSRHQCSMIFISGVLILSEMCKSTSLFRLNWWEDVSFQRCQLLKRVITWHHSNLALQKEYLRCITDVIVLKLTRIQQVKLQNIAWLMGLWSLIHSTRKFFSLGFALNSQPHFHKKKFYYIIPLQFTMVLH